MFPVSFPIKVPRLLYNLTACSLTVLAVYFSSIMCSDIHLLLCACVVRSCPDVPDVHLYQLRVRTLKPEPAVQWLSFVLLTYIGHLECQWAHLRRIRTDGMFYRLVAIFWEKKTKETSCIH